MLTIPNPHLPPVRNGVAIITANRLYKYYLHLGGTLPKEQYLKKYKEVINSIRERLLDGREVRVGGGGMLHIKGRKTNKRFIDWKATRAMWERRPELKEKRQVVYFENTHSNGIVYTVKWHGSGQSNTAYYEFKTGEPLKKQLYEAVTKEGKEFPMQMSNSKPSNKRKHVKPYRRQYES